MKTPNRQEEEYQKQMNESEVPEWIIILKELIKKIKE